MSGEIPKEEFTCPCCGENKRLPPDFPSHWLKQDPDWVLREARAGHLRWACKHCLASKKAVAGAPKRQYHGNNLPIYAYWDQALTCEQCGVSFVFSKHEQKHWVEELKFYQTSYPKECLACRRKHHQQVDLQKAISIALENLDASNCESLRSLASLYFENGSYKKAYDYLQKAKKTAGDPATGEEIETLLAHYKARLT